MAEREVLALRGCQVRVSSTGMKRWMKMMRFVGCLCVITLVSIAYISYLCGGGCSSSDKFRQARLSHRHEPLASGKGIRTVTFDEAIGDESAAFNMSARDVMVFLHIQKTGGTIFGRHLVKDLILEKPCFCPRKRKRCDCIRPDTANDQWLFSRYSTGWKCGLHADWTELNDCVEGALNEYEGGPAKKRRYFFVTILRDPVHRYISEFRHVQRGATWKTSRHWCGGREFNDLPLCYKGANWTGVDIEQFMDCSFNLASNRQTRMLADLNLVGCYNATATESEERGKVLLASAKANLARMAYFGLTEQQQASQYVFEETFKLDFEVAFEQYNATLSSLTFNELTQAQLERIRQLNNLDVELYAYASSLLDQRFQQIKQGDPYFDQHWDRLGRANVTEHYS